MACNYTETFTRIVGLGVLFALAATVDTALATEVDGSVSAHGSADVEQSESGLSMGSGARASASVSAGGSQDDPAPANDGEAGDGEPTTDGTDGSHGEFVADAGSHAGAVFNAALTTTSEAIDEAEAGATGAIDETLESSAALIADAEETSSEMGDELANSLDTSLSGDVAASVEAAVRDDVRSTVQEEIATEIIHSLPLPGRD